MGGTALIAASNYVHVCVRGDRRGGGCVGMWMCVTVGVGVTAWVRKGVCG